MPDPASPQDPVPPAAPPPAPERLTYNAKLGLVLFAAYTSLYAQFVLASAFRVEWMGKLLGGVPVSVWAGFGLIAAAVALAVLYGSLARDEIGNDEVRMTNNETG